MGHAGEPGTLEGKLHGYRWWRSIGSPQFICAPMVDRSELAFRLLTRRYNCDAAYTPMLHSRLFCSDPHYREKHFSTTRDDRPLVAQLCGDSPETLLEAARILEGITYLRCDGETSDETGGPVIDAVDLNFGCPQGIARRGHYGAHLLNEPDLMCRLVSALHQGLQHLPVTCKMRILSPPNTIDDTKHLARRLEEAGASALCVHGRTKEAKGQMVGECDWNAIKAIKGAVSIPVIANGGIETVEDALRCLQVTGCDAVMSAEALLEYPALFRSPSLPPVHIDALVGEYLGIVGELQTPRRLCSETKDATCSTSVVAVPDVACVKAHLFHMLHPALQAFTNLRQQLTEAHTLRHCEDLAEEVKARRREAEARSEAEKSHSEDNSLGRCGTEDAAHTLHRHRLPQTPTPIPHRGWYRRYRGAAIGGRGGITSELWDADMDIGLAGSIFDDE